MFNFVLADSVYDFILAASVVFSCLGDALKSIEIYCFRTKALQNTGINKA